MTTVLVHIGLAKTGTTSVQHALHERREACAAAGLLVPGRRHRDHRLAAYDLVGRRISGDRDVVAGSLRRLVDEVSASGRDRAVLSEELLAVARPRQVRRLVTALQPHRVEVVVGLRDLSRTLVSAWQQEVVRGATTTLDEYAAAVRDSHATGSRAGVAFWLRQDAVRVLDAWQRHVPPARIHLVTVPPAGSPPELLLERFAEAFGLPPGTLTVAKPPRNRSLGVAETEVVRRLNRTLPAALDEQAYITVIEQGIRKRLDLATSRPLQLPAGHVCWVRERAAEIVAALRDRGHVVHGDLDELLPAEPQEGPAPVSDEELLAAHEAALASLAQAHGALHRRVRSARGRARPGGGGSPPVRARAGSGARALVFGAKNRALQAADGNRAVAWAARQYLRASTRRRWDS